MRYLFLLLAFFPIYSAYAKREVFITLPDNFVLSSDDILRVQASLSGFITGETIWIKGVFVKEGSRNTFGYTKNGDTWIKHSTTTEKQRQITIDAWDNHLEVKPDKEDSGFVGDGEYLFKIGYYYQTQGGNRSSVQWSDTLPLRLTIPVSTPTQTPLPTAAPTKKKTPTQEIIPTVRQPSRFVSPTIGLHNTPLNETDLPLFETKVATSSHSSYQEVAYRGVPVSNVLGESVEKEIISRERFLNESTSRSMVYIIASVISIISVLLAILAGGSWYFLHKRRQKEIASDSE